MKSVEISKEEHVLLRNHLRLSPLVLIRSKCQALLMFEKGLSSKDIGDIVSRDERTIDRWLKDWDGIRMASIFTGHEGNQNASKLTREQRQEIKETLGRAPSERGLPKQFWDVPTLKEYVKVKFGTVYESELSYHFLLKFSNLSFKYPDSFDRRRNEVLIEARIDSIRMEIEPFLKDPEWEVFVSDEVRIELESFTRRAWLKKGARTVVKVNRKRESQSYIGLLNQKSYVCHTYEMTWQNQSEVLRALDIFLKEYPDKKICIIWDNAAFHRGKEIRQALENGGILERVHLIPLPPYAPDKNPIEHVWNDAKGAIVNIQYDTLAETKAAFTDHINRRTFNYQI